MSDRTLTVRLRAVVDGYNSALDSAGRKTDELATRADRIDAIGRNAQATGGKLTRGLTLPIAGIGAAALYTAGQYEASMREVQALTDASGSQMQRLGGLAQQMGADTQFSANEAAQALTQLIKGGFDAEQAYSALPGVMQLAAAATIDIASAADIATNVLSGFGLEVSDLAHVNDILAQTANSTDTDVRELGEAFKYVGPVARGAGLSIEETASVLGLFAENGIRGSMAGTALRGAITALLNPTNKVAQELEELGINAVDSNGQLVSMEEVVSQLADSGATTADIMAIFGQRAGPAMVALVAQGSDSVSKFTETLENSKGVAQDLADAKMGGLTGAVEELKGSLETLAITAGEAGLSGAVAGLARWFTGLANAASSANPTLLRSALGIAGIAAASGPAIWAFGKLATMYGPVVSGAGQVVGALRNIPTVLSLIRTEGTAAFSLLGAGLGPGAAVMVGLAALGGLLYFAHRAAQDFRRSHVDAGSAAVALASAAGIATQEISALNDEQERGQVSSDDFRKANEDAILTLREFENAADQEAFLVEVGYQMVLRGASPEEALGEVEKLAAAAGVEVPVDLNVRNIGDFDNQVAAVEQTAKRVKDALADLGAPATSAGAAITADLDKIARAAADAFQVGDTAGFVEILAAAEEQLGDNATATNYLADQALTYADVADLSTGKTANMSDALSELTSGASAATSEQQKLINTIIDTASEMDGGLTPSNLRAAAAQHGAGEAAAEYAGKVAEIDGPAGEAEAAVAELEGGLDDQAQAAEDAQKALEDYLDALRGSVDPFFAMAGSLRDNEKAQFDLIKAQGDYDTAVAEHGPNSLQAWDAGMKLADAQQRVADTAFDVTEAALELKRGIDDGSISMETANLLLLQWTSQGLIGADTAQRLAEQFGLVALQAGAAAEKTLDVHGAIDNLDGASATVTITADITPLQSRLRSAGQAIAQIKGTAIWPNTGLTTGQVTDAIDATTPGGGRATGGPVRAGFSYLVGENGPERLHMLPGGNGYVDPSPGVGSPDMSYSSVSPALNDARIVDAINSLAARLDSFDSNGAPMFGEYHVHGVERPQSTAELIADAKLAKALVS